MSICMTCGGYGFEGGCKDCGKDSTPSIELAEITSPEKFVRKCEWNLIPHEYIGLKWDKAYLEAEYGDKVKNLNVARYLDQCHKFHEVFMNGKILNKSFYFFAPPRFGKDILAFSCMQFAQKNGLSVAPYLDTMDVKRLMVLGAENPKYKILGRINYDDYITSDVLFVTVTKTSYLKESYFTILELLSKRSRYGLPTYFMSEYSIEDLTRDCPDVFKDKLLKESIHVNELKYPCIAGFNNF